ATNDLQSNSINMNDIFVYFNLLIEECSELESQLRKKALISYNLVCKEAVVKVLCKYEKVLTLGKKQKLEAFIVERPIVKESPLTIKQ
ncbi:38043_t:CDS:1, partial [Gigaspora margarita]